MARPPAPNDPHSLLRAGAARHAEGDLAAAERLYRQVLKAMPEEPDAHNLLGVLARQRGDVAGALRHTERALARQPEVPAFLANRGAALAEAGRLAEAVTALRAALARRPEDAVTLRNLGQALCALGDARRRWRRWPKRCGFPGGARAASGAGPCAAGGGDAAGAAAAAEAALARAGEGPLAAQARFLLAALGRGRGAGPGAGRLCARPLRSIRPALRGGADRGAGLCDSGAAGRAAGGGGGGAGAGAEVLDLGCGTGLSGVALAPFARRLEGLDLSPRMLAEARKRGLYDALHEADLLDWLPGRSREPGAAFGLVAAADVLNYLGDLGPALAAIAGALAPGGRAAFSVEAGTGAPFALGEAMRFRHDPAHVVALAAAAGLSLRGGTRRHAADREGRAGGRRAVRVQPAWMTAGLGHQLAELGVVLRPGLDRGDGGRLGGADGIERGQHRLGDSPAGPRPRHRHRRR